MICAHKYWNPSDVSVGGLSFASQSIEPTSVYDFIETDEDMKLSMVKEQLNHFRIKKVTKEECKDPLAWWRTHEIQFSYVGFIVWKKIWIVGSQIEAERVFSITSIYTNLQHSWLGIENIEMLIKHL